MWLSTFTGNSDLGFGKFIAYRYLLLDRSSHLKFVVSNVEDSYKNSKCHISLQNLNSPITKILYKHISISKQIIYETKIGFFEKRINLLVCGRSSAERIPFLG